MNRTALVDDYLRTVITTDGRGRPLFSSWFVLQDMRLAAAMAEAMAELAQESCAVKSSCILANSGTPLGVLVAQALRHPMHFYCSIPWEIDAHDYPFPVYPRIPGSDSVWLVDSHVRTGFTSDSCHGLLQPNGVSVPGILAAVDFGAFAEERQVEHRVPLIALSDARNHTTTLMQQLGCSSPEMIGEALSAARSLAHDEQFLPRVSDGTGYVRSKKLRLRSILKSLLRPRSGSDQGRPSTSFAGNLQKRFGSTESEMWRFFTDAESVKEASLAANDAVDLNSFDVIVGTGHLGTVLAICLAWYNRFEGSILSSKLPLGWNTGILNHGPVRCLLVSARLWTGYYTLGAAHLLSKHGVKPSMLLALRLSTDSVGFLRRGAIQRLDRLGIPLKILS